MGPLRSDQTRTGPSIVPELFVSPKSASEGPNDHPQDHAASGFKGRERERAQQGQRRQKPNPTEQVPTKCTRLRGVFSVFIDQTEVPSFHRQGLALGPEPSEINADHPKQKGHQTPAVVQGVPYLVQGAVEVTGQKNHAKHQNAFVDPAGHAAAEFRGQQDGLGRFKIWGVGQRGLPLGKRVCEFNRLAFTSILAVALILSS